MNNFEKIANSITRMQRGMRLMVRNAGASKATSDSVGRNIIRSLRNDSPQGVLKVTKKDIFSPHQYSRIKGSLRGTISNKQITMVPRKRQSIASKNAEMKAMMRRR